MPSCWPQGHFATATTVQTCARAAQRSALELLADVRRSTSVALYRGRCRPNANFHGRRPGAQRGATLPLRGKKRGEMTRNRNGHPARCVARESPERFRGRAGANLGRLRCVCALPLPPPRACDRRKVLEGFVRRGPLLRCRLLRRLRGLGLRYRLRLRRRRGLGGLGHLATRLLLLRAPLLADPCGHRPRRASPEGALLSGCV